MFGFDEQKDTIEMRFGGQCFNGWFSAVVERVYLVYRKFTIGLRKTVGLHGIKIYADHPCPPGSFILFINTKLKNVIVIFYFSKMAFIYCFKIILILQAINVVFGRCRSGPRERLINILDRIFLGKLPLYYDRN